MKFLPLPRFLSARFPALHLIWGCCLGTIFATTASATEHFVSSDDDIRDLVNAASIKPGDIVTWRDGTYVDQGINFNAMGTAEARILLRAETPGGVTLKGNSFIKFGGDYITADGFRFYNGDNYLRDIGSSVIQFRSNNGNRHAHYCRLTNTEIYDMNSHEQDVDDDDEDGDTTEFIFANSKWIQIYGTNNRVDHCRFAKKIVRGALIVAELVPQDGDSGTPYPSYNHQIDHNIFGPNPVGFSDNEFETVRIGTSTYANYNSASIIENNYFYQANGEIEVISNKSSNNIYRYNTLIECQGSIVMRHGDGCLVEGNVILGNGVANTGGIRLNGQDHIVRNNLVAGTRGTGLRAAFTMRRAESVTSADTNGGYEQVRFAQVINNTFYDNTQTFNLAESGSKANSLVPTASTIANNILYATSGTLITAGSVPTSMTYATNLVFGTTVGFSHAGFVEMDPLLAVGSDQPYRLTAASPAIGAATLAHLAATDMDGQLRADPGDIGADEFMTTVSLQAPLSETQAGPIWLQEPTLIKGAVANLSARAEVRVTKNGPFTPINPGFVITGEGTKRILIRGIGPSLADLAVDNALPDPTLTLYDADGKALLVNDDWDSDNATAISEANMSTGAFPLIAGRKDAAFVVDLPPGLYTAVLNSNTEDAGVALVEFYDVDSVEEATAQLINTSARAQVGTGDGVLIPGIVVRGESSQRFLIRAIGPGLIQFKVDGTLVDPMLEIFQGQTVIATNDNWSDQTDAAGVASAAQSVSAFALEPGSTDAALVVELEPGLYTARVSGVGATTGEALVEIYLLDITP